MITAGDGGLLSRNDYGEGWRGSAPNDYGGGTIHFGLEARGTVYPKITAGILSMWYGDV